MQSLMLIVGVSVRSLLQSARAAGVEALGLDYFGDVDGGAQSLVFDQGAEPSLKNLLSAAAAMSAGGLLYGSGPENTPELLADWAAANRLWGNSPAALARCRDPRQLRSSLAAVGEVMPDFCDASAPPLPADRRWLLKPTFRGSGHGIRFLPSTASARRDMLSRAGDPRRYIVQEYIDGVPFSVTFLANGRDSVVVGSSRQLTFAAPHGTPFCYGGNIVPFDGAASLTARLARVAARLTADFGLVGLNTLDGVMRGTDVYWLELNPRWSASVELIEQWRQQNLFPAHLAACRDHRLALPSCVSSPEYYGKYIVYNDGPALTVPSYDWSKLVAKGLRDLPRPHIRIGPNEPICTVLATAASAGDCRQELERRRARAFARFAADPGN